MTNKRKIQLKSGLKKGHYIAEVKEKMIKQNMISAHKTENKYGATWRRGIANGGV